MQTALEYQKLKCWNCGEIHKHISQSCLRCHGWLLPTWEKGCQTPIDWAVFVIISTESDEAKRRKLTQAVASIKNGRNTAVLATKSPGSPYNLYRTGATAVFIQRPEKEPLLSLSKLSSGNLSASSRRGNQISLSKWKDFEKIVGVPKVTYFLPDSFPKPEQLQEELDLIQDGNVGKGCARGRRLVTQALGIAHIPDSCSWHTGPENCASHWPHWRNLTPSLPVLDREISPSAFPALASNEEFL